MLELDECNQLLVTTPFSDDSSPMPTSPISDTLVTMTGSTASSKHHPLRSRSVSPALRCNTPSIPSVTMAGCEDETRPSLTRLLGLDGLSADVVAPEDDHTTTGKADDYGDIIVHSVGPRDSFPGVALRYGVSIAAIRRANQLWPSDPIHLRTELVIPRGDTIPARYNKTTHGGSTDAHVRPPVEPTPDLFPSLVSSSFVVARNMTLSLPARMSLESLSSKASASEDHELDDLQTARASKISASEAPFGEEGYELPALAVPRARYGRPGVSLSSLDPRLRIDDQRSNSGHIPPVCELRSRRPISASSRVSVEHLSRMQPFTVLPVRTSQLEPEPAMELPVRPCR